MLLKMILLCSLAKIQIMGAIHFHCGDVDFDCKFYDLLNIFNNDHKKDKFEEKYRKKHIDSNCRYILYMLDHV